jgi:hypothetical protein
MVSFFFYVMADIDYRFFHFRLTLLLPLRFFSLCSCLSIN